ncbi:hypothetical protein F8388_016787 [Cannabis sativa]|uniref:Cytokinin riboside 5'-monophosphate phosphoribohydrolase n=1 Tax=Cannabis sativa TaxID=3483 RepID=A0A7J6ERG5_CANSA|nr:hypothetical protein F8388_016787 [Cannabis sativa]
MEEVEVTSLTKGNNKKRKFKRICVYCGSRVGYKSAFSDAALELGKQMVERKIDLVYGGGSIGLMGLVSRTVFNGGCHVLGVIPTALLPHEISGDTIGELKAVADMHQRKSEMEKHADAFIALPGLFNKKHPLYKYICVGLLNVDGYYNNLLALFDKGVDEGFIDHSARHIVVIANTAEDLINKMEEYAPIHEKVAPRERWEVDQLLESTQSEDNALI